MPIDGLYSIQFLHQITTQNLSCSAIESCIVSNFYIKSQQEQIDEYGFYVV